MQRIKGLGMVGAETGHLQRWELFAGHCMGMAVSPHPRDGLRLRIDDRAQRFWISEGPLEDVTFLGWEAEDAAAVDTLAADLAARNVEVEWGTDQELEDRGVERFFRFRDPTGNPHEIFCGAEIAPEPFRSPTLLGEFVTGEQGLGHCVVFQRDVKEAEKFFRELGFFPTDYIHEVAGPFEIDLVFMHVNPRHHSIGLAPKMSRRRIDHVMLQVDNLDDVGCSFDRLIDNGMLIQETIGRHPNDECISYYVRTPSGWKMEMGWGPRTVYPGETDVPTFDRMSTWGHRHTDNTTRFEA